MQKTQLNEHIKKMLYKSEYVISESPIYRAVMDDKSFDPIPEGWNMKEAEGAISPASGQTSASSAPDPAAQPVGTAAPTQPTPDPAAAPQGNATPAAEPAPSPAPPTAAPSPVAPAPDLGPTKEELQKKVMEYQLDAMRGMSRKMDELEGLVLSLNSQLAQFSKEVEKVKEPTDVEKFDNRKLDSHPYYFNLNDMWNNNTFQGRMDSMNSKGMIKTEDGYMADFDQLPKLSQYEVKDSFDKF